MCHVQDFNSSLINKCLKILDMFEWIKDILWLFKHMKITQKICKFFLFIKKKINVIALLRSVDRLSKYHLVLLRSVDRLSNHSFFLNARKKRGKNKKMHFRLWLFSQRNIKRKVQCKKNVSYEYILWMIEFICF